MPICDIIILKEPPYMYVKEIEVTINITLKITDLAYNAMENIY